MISKSFITITTLSALLTSSTVLASLPIKVVDAHHEN